MGPIRNLTLAEHGAHIVPRQRDQPDGGSIGPPTAPQHLPIDTDPAVRLPKEVSDPRIDHLVEGGGIEAPRRFQIVVRAGKCGLPKPSGCQIEDQLA